MLAANSFSQACNAFAQRVGDGIDAAANSIHVLVAPPADAQEAVIGDDSHVLNFFFFRVAPFDFDADLRSDEVLRLRLYCMITAFGKKLDDVPASEHELRMLGGVLRVLHEQPVMALGTFENETVEVQVVLQRTDAEELNYIWSTQGDAKLRGSLIYEIALAPVVPKAAPLGAGLVGATGVEVFPHASRSRVGPGSFTGVLDEPAVEAATIDTTDEAWAPIICFVRDGRCAQTVSVSAGSAEAAGFVGPVWIAGEAGAGVTLRWQTWKRTSGWADEPATVDAAAVGPTLDPEAVPPGADLVDVPLPGGVQDEPGQATLVAERTYTLERERHADGSPGPTRTARSNLLLVVVTP